MVADTPDPCEQARLRQSIRLAFVAALLLTEVLGWPAAEAFDWTPDPLTDAQAAMLERYVAAFSMPPYAIWLQGPDQVLDWLLGIGKGCRGSRILPAGGCGWPVFGQYRVDPEGGWKP